MLTVQKWIIPILILAFTRHVSGQVTAVPIGELTDSVRLRPKPSLILISTSWCTYCQMQKAQLKKNTDFQAASAHFYFSEFDAETREDVTFNDTTYVFRHTGVDVGIHELAYTLGNIQNQLAFPTWVLMDENFNILFTHPGVLDKGTSTKLIAHLSRNSLKNKDMEPNIK